MTVHSLKFVFTFASFLLASAVSSAHPIPSRTYLPSAPNSPTDLIVTTFELNNAAPIDMADLLKAVYAVDPRVSLCVEPGITSIQVVTTKEVTKDIEQLIRDVEKSSEKSRQSARMSMRVVSGGMDGEILQRAVEAIQWKDKSHPKNRK
jgi:hypothetical protein